MLAEREKEREGREWSKWEKVMKLKRQASERIYSEKRQIRSKLFLGNETNERDTSICRKTGSTMV